MPGAPARRSKALTKRIIKGPWSGGVQDDSARSQGIEAKTSNSRSIGKARAKLDTLKDRPLLVETECRLPLAKVLIKLIGLLLVICLSLALFLSEISLSRGQPHVPTAKECGLYGLLMLFYTMILIPALFEVRRAKIQASGLTLWTLWWKAKLDWQEITEFRHPAYLKFALIRTGRMFFLVNKSDLSNYDQLESWLIEKTQSLQKKPREGESRLAGRRMNKGNQ